MVIKENYSLNDTNKQHYNRVRNVYIIYDHSISDVPKHSSDGDLLCVRQHTTLKNRRGVKNAKK